MPFGLSNIPASFQDYISKILAKKLNIFIIVYLDNILIYTENSDQAHVDTVQWVLKKLRKYGLFANLKKCQFYKNKIRFLGYVVSVQEVQKTDERKEALKNWPKPKSVCDIQVFLGFANFYQRFIQGFNKIAKPLTSILRTLSLTGSSTILQLIDTTDKDEFDDTESDGNETNLSNPSASKKSIGTGYLTSKGAKKGGGNTKKGVKAARGPDYLNPAAKNAFNHLWHAFT